MQPQAATDTATHREPPLSFFGIWQSRRNFSVDLCLAVPVEPSPVQSPLSCGSTKHLLHRCNCVTAQTCHLAEAPAHDRHHLSTHDFRAVTCTAMETVAASLPPSLRQIVARSQPHQHEAWWQSGLMRKTRNLVPSGASVRIRPTSKTNQFFWLCFLFLFSLFFKVDKQDIAGCHNIFRRHPWPAVGVISELEPKTAPKTTPRQGRRRRQPQSGPAEPNRTPPAWHE